MVSKFCFNTIIQIFFSNRKSKGMRYNPKEGARGKSEHNDYYRTSVGGLSYVATDTLIEDIFRRRISKEKKS